LNATVAAYVGVRPHSRVAAHVRVRPPVDVSPVRSVRLNADVGQAQVVRRAIYLLLQTALTTLAEIALRHW
jgi:hypothetical protein